MSEPKLVAGVYAFFATYVFGPDRRQLPAERYDGSGDGRRQQEVESIRRKQDDIAARRKRLVRSLELTDDPAGDLVRDVNASLAELRANSERLADQVAGLEVAVPDLAVLDSLPVAAVDLARLPDAEARALFDAFRLEVRYDRTAKRRALPGHRQRGDPARSRNLLRGATGGTAAAERAAGRHARGISGAGRCPGRGPAGERGGGRGRPRCAAGSPGCGAAPARRSCSRPPGTPGAPPGPSPSPPARPR